MKINTLVLLFIVLGCEQPAALDGADYAGIEVGNFKIFEVNSTLYATTEEPILLKYLHKIEITQKLDQYHFEVAHSSKQLNANTWKLDSLRVIELTPERYFTSHEELRFPLTTRSSWISANKTLKTKRFLDTYLLNAQNYRNVYEIGIPTDSSLISIRKSSFYYAKNLGLVSSFEKNIEFCQETNCIGKFQPESGFEIEKKLIEHGKN